MADAQRAWSMFSVLPAHLFIEEPVQQSGLFDTRLVALGAASVSLGVITIQTAWDFCRSHRGFVAFGEDTRSYTAKRGGAMIVAFKAARFAAALVFSVVCFITPIGREQSTAEYSVLIASSYAALISCLVLLLSPFTARKLYAHATFVFFVIFGVLAYRDVWPLMTTVLKPQGRDEGNLMWIKIALASFIGVFVPLFEPFEYVLVNYNAPQQKLNPEQTACIASLLFHVYMDPVIIKGTKVSHLSTDDLPPQCDYDYTSTIINRGYRHLDPFTSGAKSGHLAFGIIRVFKSEFASMFLLLAVAATANLGSPIGINRLLTYLETDGEGALVQPWVWVLWLGAAPILGSVCGEYYLALSTSMLVRVEALITSLVFDHALRIRLKADNADAQDAEPSAEPEVPTLLVDAASTSISGVVATAPDATARDPIATNANAAAPPSPGSTVHSGTPSGSTAGGGGKKQKAAKAEEKKASERDKDTNLAGKLSNMVTSDLDNITGGRDFAMVIVESPIFVILGSWFLYSILGWSAFAGLAVMIALIPVPAWSTKVLNGIQNKKMAASDARVNIITESMTVLRMVKLFGWEGRIQERIEEKREEELKWIVRRKIWGAGINLINFVIPFVHMVVTFFVYTYVQKQPLSASIVFSAVGGFNMLREACFTTVNSLPQLIQANVSLKRISEFLRETELLDTYDLQMSGNLVVDDSANHQNDIGFSQASFTWSKDAVESGPITPSRRSFCLHIEDELKFKRGCVNLIIGPTGSGKTSLIMSLLGELHYVPQGPGSWYNLPRAGGIAYATQESWVQNETIRHNIVFGGEFDEERYKKVIYQCSLTRDLELFEAGDATEVGEKGLTLSGGQKARITLARAVYSKAEIILLDDILAALDVQTAKWIVDKCLKGDLIRDRTVILVSHNVAVASTVADFVVSLGTDGHILSQGSVADAVAKDAALEEAFNQQQEPLKQEEVTDNAAEQEEQTEEQKTKKGKLIIPEEVAEGHLSWAALKLFINQMSPWPLSFWIAYILGRSISEGAEVLETWFLGYWARQYNLHEAGEVSVVYYLGLYAGIAGFLILTYAYCAVLFTFASVHASRKIHRQLTKSLLNCTFRWLDYTPKSRVLARCTQDIQSVDGQLANSLNEFLTFTISCLSRLIAILLVAPLFVFPGVAIAAMGFALGQVYMKSQMGVKREKSNAKAPVLASFSSAMSGLASIRAYGAEEMFRQESHNRIDRLTRSSRIFWSLNRWIAVRIDVMSALFASSLAAYLIYGSNQYTPSQVGFSLNMAVGFSQLILWVVRLFNMFEVEGNSLERIQAYIDIDQEPQPQEGGTPPAYWPSSGGLRVENLSAKYSQDGPRVLEGLSFHIKAGERVGVVGRTGSGKSTLTLSLLRCIYTDGAVFFDGVPTQSINLDAVRSNITIIPQMPELLNGTLRHNLDLFGDCDDATLNDALRSTGLFSLQDESDDSRLTLESSIASGGGNLSVGQRQIIALARAIVRQSKLLILDEATSAIDYETDAVIQQSLRKELKADVTVITVAHRLQTIMDSDKIMVLDAGRLIEFDRPSVLLKNSKSLLRALVDESADKDALYEMANAKVNSV